MGCKQEVRHNQRPGVLEVRGLCVVTQPTSLERIRMPR